MDAIADLYALQETDLALDKLLARLSEIEESLVESEELIEARGVMEEKAAALKELRAQQKDLELAAEEVRAKAAEVERKLYGGAVRNPKELEDLDADLKSIKAQVQHREDDLLALLMQVEEAEAELSSAREAYEQIESEWSKGQAEMRAEKAAIEPKVADLRAKREGEASGIDPRTMSLYQTLRERRAGVAVARVERGACQGCRISLPTSVIHKARSPNSIVQCVSCERILWLS